MPVLLNDAGQIAFAGRGPTAWCTAAFGRPIGMASCSSSSALATRWKWHPATSARSLILPDFVSDGRPNSTTWASSRLGPVSPTAQRASSSPTASPSPSRLAAACRRRSRLVHRATPTLGADNFQNSVRTTDDRRRLSVVLSLGVSATFFVAAPTAAHAAAVRTVALSGQQAPGTPSGVNYSGSQWARA